MTKTVIIGFADSLAAPEVAWDLLDAGYDVVGFARRGRRAALRASRHVRVVDVTPPEKSVAAALVDIDFLIRRLAPVVVMPLDDVSLLLTTHPEFPTVPVAAATRGAADLALDKQRQHELAAKAGLRVFPTVIVQDGESVPSDDVRFPVVVKPAAAVQVADGRVTRPGVRIVSDARSLAAARRDLSGTLLLQPWTRGVGVGVFAIVVAGDMLHVSAHRRIRMMDPRGSGSSACRSITPPSTALNGMSALLAQAHWNGIVMLEMLEDEQGDLWFMEVNGRAWGSMALALARRFTYPRWAVANAIMQPVPDRPLGQPPPRRARHIGRELIHLAAVWRGPGDSGIPWPGRLATIRDLLTVSVEDRLYNWRPHDPWVLVADLWAVLSDRLALGRR